MVSGLREFDSNRASENARAISFPRETGSKGERQAADFIAKRFRDLGLDVKEEEFTLFFSPWFLLKIGLIIGFILLLLSRLLVNSHPVIASLVIFVLMVAMLFTGPMWQWFGRRGIKNPWGKDRRSKNIIARFPEPETSSGQALYLMAHYDSKSQSLSLGGRIILISATVAGCLLLGLTYLLQARGSVNIIVQDGIFLFVTVSTVILFLNRTDNLSQGGIDNAGSIGLLLELAEILGKNLPKKINVTFIATGAEEEGLMGAYAFLNAHRDELNSERTLILNFDGIGIKGKLRLFSKIKGLPETLSRLPSLPTFSGLMMDHIPFKSEGFKAVTLACVSKEAFKIHTERDTIDLISPEGIGETEGVILDVIKELESV